MFELTGGRPLSTTTTSPLHFRNCTRGEPRGRTGVRVLEAGARVISTLGAANPPSTLPASSSVVTRRAWSVNACRSSKPATASSLTRPPPSPSPPPHTTPGKAGQLQRDDVGAVRNRPACRLNCAQPNRRTALWVDVWATSAHSPLFSLFGFLF